MGGLGLGYGLRGPYPLVATPETMRTSFNKKIKGWEGRGECEAASRVRQVLALLNPENDLVELALIIVSPLPLASHSQEPRSRVVGLEVILKAGDSSHMIDKSQRPPTFQYFQVS